jgi:hypothetical protein
MRYNAYTVDACARRSLLPSLYLIDVIYCTADTKATPASFQGVGVDFEIDIHFASTQRCGTWELRDSVVFSVVQSVMVFERLG